MQDSNVEKIKKLQKRLCSLLLELSKDKGKEDSQFIRKVYFELVEVLYERAGLPDKYYDVSTADYRKFKDLINQVEGWL